MARNEYTPRRDVRRAFASISSFLYYLMLYHSIAKSLNLRLLGFEELSI